MGFDELIAGIRHKAMHHRSFDRTAKFDLGPDGMIYWDGTINPPLVRSGDGSAEVTLSMTADVLGQILQGTLDPASAYLNGEISVAGDLDVALEVGRIFSGDED